MTNKFFFSTIWILSLRANFAHISGKETIITRTFYSQKYSATSHQKDSELRNVILFDGLCNFCNSWVDTLIKFDKNNVFSFTSLQSTNGKDILRRIGRNPEDISTVVLVKTIDEVYYKSDVPLKVVELLGVSPPFINLLGTVINKSIRDKLYDGVASNRYKIMGKRETCRCSDSDKPAKFL